MALAVDPLFVDSRVLSPHANLHLGLVLILAPLSNAPAQDMVAADWNGNIYRVNSRTGVTTFLGFASFGQNAIGVAGGIIWSVQRTGLSFPWNYDLKLIDPVTGAATVIYSNIREIRGMAGDGSNTLWCMLEAPSGGTDQLATLDVSTGVIVPIGSTGFLSIQSLALLDGTLYAVDTTHGLLVVDQTTGVATDIDTSVGIPFQSNIQFLATRCDGALIAGRGDLYEVDPVTGMFTLIGSLAGIDFRGMEEYYGSSTPIGTGCMGAFGPVSLTVSGSLDSGGTFSLSSDNHTAGSPGALLIGFAPFTPVSLDALFGTMGCSLLVDPVLTAGGSTPMGPGAQSLTFQFTLGNLGGVSFFFQNLVFEPRVPGSLSLSNAAQVCVGY